MGWWKRRGAASGHRSGGAPSEREIAAWMRECGLDQLPSFLTVDEFVAEVARRRGRPIRVLEDSSMRPPVTGWWLGGDEADVVLVCPGATGVRRDEIVLHELAHIVCDHGNCSAAEPELSADLLAAIGPVSRVRARGDFSSFEERQAEWMAMFLVSRTRRMQRRTWLASQSATYGAELLHGHS